MELLLEADVTVYPSGGRPMEGRLQDVGAGEVTVMLLDDRRPPPAKNQRVRLQIQLRKVEKPMNIVATLLERRREDDRVVCVFRFTHMATTDNNLPPDIYSVFNRRQMFRVRPDPKHPIQATLRSIEEDEHQLEAQARVTDLSGSGAGLIVEAKEAAPFNCAANCCWSCSCRAMTRPSPSAPACATASRWATAGATVSSSTPGAPRASAAYSTA